MVGLCACALTLAWNGSRATLHAAHWPFSAASGQSYQCLCATCLPLLPYLQAVMGRWPRAVLQVGERTGPVLRCVVCAALPNSAVGQHHPLGIQLLLWAIRFLPQFEDFNIEHAAPLLERYRYSHVSTCNGLMFSFQHWKTCW